MSLPANIAEWPEDWLFLWHERAGIIEYEARMPRHVAERLAAEDIRKQEAAAALHKGEQGQ